MSAQAPSQAPPWSSLSGSRAHLLQWLHEEAGPSPAGGWSTGWLFAHYPGSARRGGPLTLRQLRLDLRTLVEEGHLQTHRARTPRGMSRRYTLRPDLHPGSR